MKTHIDIVLERLEGELNMKYPLYDSQSVVVNEDLRDVLDEVHRLRKELSVSGGNLMSEQNTNKKKWADMTVEDVGQLVHNIIQETITEERERIIQLFEARKINSLIGPPIPKYINYEMDRAIAIVRGEV